MANTEGPEEHKAHQCVDCKVWSPQTQTNYTLISSRHGWRLSREVAPDGTKLVQWRCPACWTKYKKAQGPR